MNIGYARVSTTEQNVKSQVAALKAAGCSKIFSDKLSGGKADRPGLTSAIDQLRSGDTLVVWKLDRLARSVRDLLNLTQQFQELGADLKVLDGLNVSLSTSDGKLMLSIFGAIAEFERDLARERTIAGIKYARSRGRKGGRPRKLGDRQARSAKMRWDDSNNNESLDDIAASFNVSRMTMWRAIQRVSTDAKEKHE